jgi:hypothetical protein
MEPAPRKAIVGRVTFSKEVIPPVYFFHHTAALKRPILALLRRIAHGSKIYFAPNLANPPTDAIVIKGLE